MMLLALPLALAASADEGPHWEATIEAAKRQAAQSNRLVLVHFVMNDCIYCKKLEANVYAKPGVGPAIEGRFVPVKLNADDFPGTARLYGIDRFPSDVILTPTGRVLYKLGCPQEPGKYLAQLNQAAAAANGSAIAQEPPLGTWRSRRGRPRAATPTTIRIAPRQRRRRAKPGTAPPPAASHVRSGRSLGLLSGRITRAIRIADPPAEALRPLTPRPPRHSAIHATPRRNVPPNYVAPASSVCLSPAVARSRAAPAAWPASRGRSAGGAAEYAAAGA